MGRASWVSNYALELMTMVSRKNVTAAVWPFWMHFVVSLHYIHSLKSRQPSECDPRPGRGEWRWSLVLFLASERACRVNVQWSGSTAIRDIRVRASSTDAQHRRTYRHEVKGFQICPIFWCTSRLKFPACTMLSEEVNLTPPTTCCLLVLVSFFRTTRYCSVLDSKWGHF